MPGSSGTVTVKPPSSGAGWRRTEYVNRLMSQELHELRDRETSLVKDSAKRLWMQNRPGVHRDRDATTRPTRVTELDVASTLTQLRPTGAPQYAKRFASGNTRQPLSHRVSALERRETERRKLICPAPCPVRIGHPRPHPFPGGLEGAGEGGDVIAEDLAVAHADLAVDDGGVEVFGLGRVNDVLDRVAEGSHEETLAFPDQEVGFGAGGDAAEVVATECPGTAEGSGVEDVGGGGDLGPAIDQLADGGRPPQCLDHALGAGVGAERHVDAAREVAGEAFHRDPAAGEDPDAMGDVGAGVREDGDVVAVVIGPAPAGDHDRVAEDNVRAEKAEMVQPLDRRAAVAACHLLELGDRLGGVEGERHTE